MKSAIQTNSVVRRHAIRTVARGLRRHGFEPYVLFPLFALLLLVVAWAGMAHVIRVEGAVATRAAAESGRQLADTYEAQMVRNLVAIDQTLKTVKYAYERHDGSGLAQLQAKGLLPSAIVFQIMVADRDGAVIASARPLAPSSVATAPFFTAQRERNDDALGPFVSRVERNARSGAPEITFSRRLDGSDGTFAGVVSVTVDPAYFTSGYDTGRMGGKGLLALLGVDGIMRVQRVGEDTVWGAAPGKPSGDGNPDAATLRAWDHGEPRYTSVRALHGFPLMAIVGLSHDEQLAAFREHKRAYVRQTTVGSLFLGILALILSRNSWLLARSRQRVRQAQETYYAASEASLDGFFVWESVYAENGEMVDFVLRDTNRRGVELCGRSRDALIGAPLDNAFPGSHANGAFAEFLRVVQLAAVEEREWLHARPDGSALWLHQQVVRVESGVVSIVRDISSRKLAEVRRAGQNRVLEMIAASTPLEEVLDSLVRLMESQIPGSACAALLRDEDAHYLKVGAAPNLPESYGKAVHGARIGPEAGPSGRAVHLRAPVYETGFAADGSRHEWLYAAGMDQCGACWSLPVLSHDGTALGALTVFVREPHEPTSVEVQTLAMSTRIAGIAIERSQAEERIRYMANHDALTGLPNRTLLADRLGQVLIHAQRSQHGVTVVFIDLDNFKLINDSLGHRAGDDLLTTVARRMVQCVHRTDTVVRLGGDEFVIVLFDETRDEIGVHATIERLRGAILAPIELGGQKLQITCSMGLASYPADGANAETLLMNADAAMYRAKELGRNNYQMFTPEMNNRVHERLRMQEQLRQALANDEFRVVYQPQVDSRTGAIFGVEALLRWDHPTDGTISPATFIPVAEETGLIGPIGNWVLRTACEQNKAWQDAGLPAVTVSVNVSARQFLDKEWVDCVALALSESGLEPKYLELELTESLIMQDLDGAIATMRQFQEMGVSLSIDDFGTGYSSLSALKHFPIARLKIDKSFVRELPYGEDDRAIAMAVISLGRKLNLKVIAEGVETQQQLDFLRENDCHEIQGYHFSRPVSARDVAHMLTPPFAWPAEMLSEAVS
jgi:diguanylate cyclase (GGDEF)-like protein/PAS domain S-box-containing protein